MSFLVNSCFSAVCNSVDSEESKEGKGLVYVRYGINAYHSVSALGSSTGTFTGMSIVMSQSGDVLVIGAIPNDTSDI